jgi:hypothetical protein
MSETKEQMAERLTIGATLRTPYEQEALILAALREVEAAAHCLRSTSQIISAEQRAEKAEAEMERLREIESCPSGYVNISKAVYANLRAEVERLRAALLEEEQAAREFCSTHPGRAQKPGHELFCYGARALSRVLAALATPAKEPKP